MDGKYRAAVAAKRDQDFLVIARTDARAVENFAGAVQARAGLCRGRRRCDFSGSVANERGVPRFRQGNEGAAAREHDRIRQMPLLSFDELRELGYRMVIFPQSAFRVSMKATAEFLRDLKSARESARLAGENADAGGALRIARLRSGAENRGLGIAHNGSHSERTLERNPVAKTARSRYGILRIALLAQVDGKAC